MDIITFTYSDIFELYSIGLFFGILVSFMPFAIGMIIHIFKRITSVN